MNLFLFRCFYLAAPLTFGFSIAYGQLAPTAQNTGPIIVNYPVEKTSVTTNEVKKTPSKKSTVSTSSSTPFSGSDSAGTLPTALSNAPVLKTSSPSSLVPDEDSLAPGEEVIQAVKRGNDTIDRVNKRDGYCELCEIQRHLAEGRASEVQNNFKAKEANREGEKVAPSQDKN
ncbi:MAG: hypothetical protein H7326_01615, partial [Bdellovibrionaceae bacterium]|nr:hypothetical protein [Pseudobdellovibrionaceae bacterium]